MNVLGTAPGNVMWSKRYVNFRAASFVGTPYSRISCMACMLNDSSTLVKGETWRCNIAMAGNRTKASCHIENAMIDFDAPSAKMYQSMSTGRMKERSLESCGRMWSCRWRVGGKDLYGGSISQSSRRFCGEYGEMVSFAHNQPERLTNTLHT